LKGLSIPVTGNEKATATLALEQGLSIQALTIAKPGMTRGGVRVDQMTLELSPETGAEGSLKSPQQLLILRVAISKTGAGLGSRSTSHEFPFMVTLNAAMSAVESCSIPSAQMMSVDLGTLSNYLPAGYFSGITIPKEDGSGNLLLSGNSLTWGPQNTPAIDYDLTQSPADNQYQMRGLQCGMLSAGIGKFLFDTACSRYCTQICTKPPGCVKYALDSAGKIALEPDGVTPKCVAKIRQCQSLRNEGAKPSGTFTSGYATECGADFKRTQTVFGPGSGFTGNLQPDHPNSMIWSTRCTCLK
jgi:hypothetical protein